MRRTVYNTQQHTSISTEDSEIISMDRVTGDLWFLSPVVVVAANFMLTVKNDEQTDLLLHSAERVIISGMMDD